jgi:DNA helicase-2/ATP-dependent DNA helicase PcrA
VLDDRVLLEGLNPQQVAAVTHQGPPLLVVAGAGSGKTRVLVHRIGWLLSHRGVAPGQVLAITFTNKAAGEMKERVAALVGPRARAMWVLTFHSACVRILREQAARLGRRASFSIYDQDDSRRLFTLVARDLDVDPKRLSARALAAQVGALKNELIDPAEAARRATNDLERTIAEVYAAYQLRLEQAQAYDFDDLILQTVHLLQAFPDVAEHYRRRFRHVLVDEYQDTNKAQYELVRAIVGDDDDPEKSELCVVGDADQSIYAFRGADIRNIVEFERDYPDARTVVLEQNYRSTQTILSAANAVIRRNPGRTDKRLWSDLGAGEKIVGWVADNEHEEASFVASEVDRLTDSGEARPSDVAVFYRTNAQSRVVEDIFMRVGLPYRVVGGTRFYDRREVRDALAYLRAIENPDDTVNVRRILGVPRRGIGDRTEEQVQAWADRNRQPFGWALARAAEVPGLGSRAVTALQGFHGLMQGLREVAAEAGPVDVLREVLARSGYLSELEASSDPQDESRVENLQELIGVAAEHEARLATLEPPARATLATFLEQVSLVADADAVPDADDGVVTLMTLHNAKGLEFPVVFLTGMEDGVFPHLRSLGDQRQLEEERRLAYVGLTRAQQRLYVSRSVDRRFFGQPVSYPASRFLDDLPSDLVRWDRVADKPAQTSWSGGGSSSGGWSSGSTASSTVITSRVPPARPRPSGGSRPIVSLSVGDRVSHDTFGLGTVVATAGHGDKAEAHIDFGGEHGVRRLLLRYAPVERL